ncbi:MAG: C25 family cysteine peptidase, partial [Candidatus Eiseniibacteriota bacterium]
IDQTYPNGIDRAERVRFFLRDAYQNWGALYALLGGDTDVVPARYLMITEPEPEAIPTDMYYACLEGNWNADGDDRIGEGEVEGDPGDAIDILFDLVVGRAPVSTPLGAQHFIDKLLVYETGPPADEAFPASMLALAERLFQTTHGADQAEAALQYLPPWFKIVRLYEESASYPGSLELTAEAAVDSTNNGFGFILHVGHGYRNIMSMADGSISNADVDNLTNGERAGFVFGINCSSASIDFNAIGEHWLKNPDGGSVAYLGTSRYSYVIPVQIYQNTWFQYVFHDSLTNIGVTTELSRLPIATQLDGSFRWNMAATMLLGDPEMDLYGAPVAPLAVSHPSSIETGEQQVVVTVTSGGSPVPTAMVTLHMEDGTYARGSTNASGTATLTIAPIAPGTMTLTVHEKYYEVYQAELPVSATIAPFPHLTASTIDDDVSGPSSGDGDGLADAGETIELTLTLSNGGGLPLTSLAGTLTVDDPAGVITLVDDSVTYGSLAAGGASSGTAPYVIAIGPDAEVAYQPVLHLAITADQGAWDDVALLPIHRPYLEHLDHLVDDSLPRGDGDGLIEGGEEIWYSIDLRNSGQDAATGVSAALRVLRASDHQPHPLVTVSDDQSTFGTIAEGATVTGDRFVFTLDSSVDPSEILLEVTTTDAPHADLVEFFDVVPPATPDSLRGIGAPMAITLSWRRPADPDVRGYDVMRSTNPFGPYEQINDYLVDGSAIFEDRGLPSLTRFYYQVVARDSSRNASTVSAILSASTSPPVASGWPVELPHQTSSSPTVADLDGDWGMEILIGADMQYAWHANGREVVDGDDDPRTNGPFSLWGKETTNKGFQATQAVGDMDGDGAMEVANVGWTRDSLFVWNDTGQLLPGFPKWVFDDFNWASPVMADLDLDGDLEVIVWAAKGGRLLAWHHDGTEYRDGDENPATDGILIPRIFGITFNYATPTVCNLDEDPEPEIVFAVNIADDNSGGIYAINTDDGSFVPGWPVFTGEPGFPSQVTASPAAADLDGDGVTELVIAAERDEGTLYVLRNDGSVQPGWPKLVPSFSPNSRAPSPVVADVDGDQELDVIYADTAGQLHIWDRDGIELPGFPVTYSTLLTQTSESTPVVANVDADPRPEILFGDETGRLHAYNHDGTLVAGFPIQTGGEVRGTPAIWDADSDNLIEVVLASNDGFIYVHDLPFDWNPVEAPWPLFRHDTRNTGHLGVEIQQVAVGDPGAPGGGGAAALRPALHRAVPNPFNPATRIAFDVPGEAGGARRVRLAIYDVQGRLVRRLVDGPVGVGRQSVVWDGRGERGGLAGSGVYLARLEIDAFTAVEKLVMIR